MANPAVEQLTLARIERLLAKYRVVGSCWEWPSVSPHGYGRTSVGGRDSRAHRVFYCLFRGYMPQGMTLDHLCSNKRCVNPKHLEVVSIGDNVRRYHNSKTHCSNGHARTKDNIYDGRGRRECKACRRAAVIENRSKSRANQ